MANVKFLTQRELDKFRLTANGQAVAVVNPDGTNISGGGGGSNATVAINSSVTLFAVVNTSAGGGSTGGGFQYAQGYSLISGATGNFMLGIRMDSPAALGNNLEAHPPIIGPNGGLFMEPISGATVVQGQALPAGTNVIGIMRLQDAAGDEISVAAFPTADNAAVQNTIATSAFPLMFDGSAWDRLRGDSTNGLLVNLGANNDVTITSGATVTVHNTLNALVTVSNTVTVDSELPTAAALSDALANPTAPAVGSHMMGWNTTNWERIRSNIGDGAASTGLLNTVAMWYNGSTYDRMRGDTTNGLLVNLGANNDVTIQSGATVFLGDTTVTVGNAMVTVTLGTQLDSTNDSVDIKSGATVTPYFVSTYTSFATIVNVTANTTIFQPPSGERWIIKDLIIGTQGNTNVQILSGDSVVIPYISLATHGGYISNFGDNGLRAKAVNDSFGIILGSAATVSITANVRFE